MELHPTGTNPEDSFVSAMEAADLKTVQQIIDAHPPIEGTDFTNLHKRTGDYWGPAVAVACTDLGVPIGFKDDNMGGIVVQGSKNAINYYLNIVNYEQNTGIRDSASADSESRSGLFTLLNEPKHGEVYEHMYAAYTGTPILEVIKTDPMFEIIRHQQPATQYEITNQEGFDRLYNEDPERSTRLYLTRMLPHLKNLRSTIEFTERSLRMYEIDEEAEADEEYGKHIKQAREERAELLPFQTARLKYWQTEYDFTTSLLLEGYEPYSMDDIIPVARDYIVSLLAAHPELSPTDLKVDIPDIKAALGAFVKRVEDRDKSE